MLTHENYGLKSIILFLHRNISKNLFKEKSSLFILPPYERKQSCIITFGCIPDLGIYFCLPESSCRCHRPIYVQRYQDVYRLYRPSSSPTKDIKGERQSLYQISSFPLFYLRTLDRICIYGPADRYKIYYSWKGRFYYKPLHTHCSYPFPYCGKESIEENMDMCIRRLSWSVSSFHKQ